MQTLSQIVDRASAYALKPVEQVQAPKFTEFQFTDMADMPKFDLETVQPCVRSAHASTRAWVKAILDGETPAHWLTMFGVPGCGKTMLAKLARHTLKDRGQEVQLWNWPRVWRMCLDGEWGILDHLMNLPILILDDVGAEFTGSNKTSELNSARLYEIAESRLGKWTLITSNLSPDQMARSLGERFVSRIFRGNSVVNDMLTAHDYSFRKWQLAQNA